jgi:hypothetical protein
MAVFESSFKESLTVSYTLASRLGSPRHIILAVLSDAMLRWGLTG